MKIKLVKLNNISNYEQWLQQTVSSLDLSSGLSTNLLSLLHERDALGSVQISEHVIMSHIVTDEITESIVIVSQLINPVSYFTSKDINTAISTLSQVLSKILSNFILKYRPNREMAPGESS